MLTVFIGMLFAVNSGFSADVKPSYSQINITFNIVNEKNSIARIEQRLDSKGNIIEEKKFDSGKNLIDKFEYAYDTNNNRIRAVYYNCLGWLCSKEEYEYDGAGNVLSESRYFNGALISQDVKKKTSKKASISSNVILDERTDYIYDRFGNKIKAVKIDCYGNVCFMDELTYTNSGWLTTMTRSLGDKVLSRMEYKYDRNGNKVEQTSYSTNNIKMRRDQFQNDSQGRMVQQNSFTPEGVFFERRTYAYDAAGNNTEILIYDRNQKPAGSISQIFDAKGNLVERTERNGSGTSTRKQLWQFDNDGFLTRERTYLFRDGAAIPIQDVMYEYR